LLIRRSRRLKARGLLDEESQYATLDQMLRWPGADVLAAGATSTRRRSTSPGCARNGRHCARMRANCGGASSRESIASIWADLKAEPAVRTPRCSRPRLQWRSLRREPCPTTYAGSRLQRASGPRGRARCSARHCSSTIRRRSVRSGKRDTSHTHGGSSAPTFEPPRASSHRPARPSRSTCSTSSARAPVKVVLDGYDGAGVVSARP
jgi:hypothetical protein